MRIYHRKQRAAIAWRLCLPQLGFSRKKCLSCLPDASLTCPHKVLDMRSNCLEKRVINNPLFAHLLLIIAMQLSSRHLTRAARAPGLPPSPSHPSSSVAHQQLPPAPGLPPSPSHLASSAAHQQLPPAPKQLLQQQPPVQPQQHQPQHHQPDQQLQPPGKHHAELDFVLCFPCWLFFFFFFFIFLFFFLFPCFSRCLSLSLSLSLCLSLSLSSRPPKHIHEKPISQNFAESQLFE